MLPIDALARPDLRLLTMAVLMLVTFGASLALSIPFRIAAPIGSTFAGVAMLDGILLRPPIDD